MRDRWFDVALVGYPKCGNTWVQVMLRRALVQAFDLDPSWLPRILGRCPDRPEGVPAVAVTHNMPQFNTETAADLVVDNDKFDGKRVILLARDPRDTLVSLYMHNVHRCRPPLFAGTADEMVHDPIHGLDKLLKFYRAWDRDWDRPASIELVRYEDLRADPMPLVARILQVVGLTATPELVQDVVDFGSFDNMRRLERTDALGLSTLAPPTSGQPDAYKVRRGEVGRAHETLSADTLQWIDERVAAEMPPRFGYAAAPA